MEELREPGHLVGGIELGEEGRGSVGKLVCQLHPVGDPLGPDPVLRGDRAVEREAGHLVGQPLEEAAGRVRRRAASLDGVQFACEPVPAPALPRGLLSAQGTGLPAELLIGLADRVPKFTDPRFLRGRGGPHRGGKRGVAAVPEYTPFGNMTEEGEELIELPLRHGVVFVVVAASAPQGQGEPGCPGGLEPIHHVLGLPLLIDGPELGVEPVVPVEPRGHLLPEGGVGEEVAGQLLEGELVERHVGVERLDHVVPPAPHGAPGIALKPAAVGVPGHVQPAGGHVLAVAGALEKPVDKPSDRPLPIPLRLFQEPSPFLHRQGNPGERQRKAAAQGFRRGLSGRGQTFPFEP